MASPIWLYTVTRIFLDAPPSTSASPVTKEMAAASATLTLQLCIKMPKITRSPNRANSICAFRYCAIFHTDSPSWIWQHSW